MVYGLSRRSVEETASWLQAQGVDALPYHAGLAPRERNLAQDRFLSEEGLIVVATVAFGIGFGIGIDKPNVRFVAHLDLPKSLEGYSQETPKARALLREDTFAPKPARPERDRAPRKGGALVDHQDRPLFEALRQWRLAKAREQAVPPYVIFNDATLKIIAELRPGSLPTLDTVSGVETHKLEQYGEDVLAVVRTHSGRR